MEGNFSQRGLREFRIVEGSRNRGENYRVSVKQIQEKRQLVRVIGRFEKLGAREIGILVYNMNIPRPFHVLPEMTRAQQELQILRKLTIVTNFRSFRRYRKEFNPGHALCSKNNLRTFSAVDIFNA